MIKDMKRQQIRKIRYGVQIWFLLFSFWIGLRFYAFSAHFELPGRPFVQRPPSVEAFLPIAGMIGFKHFLLTGNIDPLHPAAVVTFTAIIAVSLLLKKGFCGWICPVGTLSQGLWMAGERLFGRTRIPWRHADMLLRVVKYALMAFFLYVVGITMSEISIAAFFSSDYYKVADIKTMKFFTEMSKTTFWFLVITGGLSLLYKNVWCRYLCPYGALLGLLSLLSPAKVQRDDNKCIHCRACSRNCPSLIDVEKKRIVSSPECFGCLTCVSHCPAEGALDLTAGTGGSRRPVPPFFYPAALLLIFFAIIGAAIVSGHWQSAISYDQYMEIISSGIDGLSHP